MTVVLDASALLAVIYSEAGAEKVTEAMNDATISVVNLSETFAKMLDRGFPERDARLILDGFSVRHADFDTESCFSAGALRAATRKRGLSFADRACLALARREQATVLTTDRAWADLDLGVDVQVIR